MVQSGQILIPVAIAPSFFDLRYRGNIAIGGILLVVHVIHAAQKAFLGVVDSGANRN